MRPLIPLKYLTLIALIASSTSVFSETLSYDIVVNGGSFSAVSAAFAAARENPSAKVLLIEPTDWLGGQATSQGVSAIDNSYHAPANSVMASNPSAYYAADYLDFLDGMRNSGPDDPGTGYAGLSGWVSRDCYDPRSGAWALDKMAAEYSNLTVIKLTVVKDLSTSPVTDDRGDGLIIDSLSLIERTAKPGYTPFDDFLSQELNDWYRATESSRFTKTTHTVVPRDAARGMIVIDASEVGDIIVLSEAVYTQGREVSTERVDNDGTLPVMNDDQTMATVYPFVMTTTNNSNNEEYLKTPFEDFDNYLALRTSNYFSLGSFSWTDVWTYRRLFIPGGGSASRYSINNGDVSMQNWNPGNDFLDASWLLDMATTNAQASSDWMGGVNLMTLANAEKHAMAWYFWLKARTPALFPGVDTDFLDGSDPLNMMGTAHGLTKFPYIRGTRRLVGLDNFRISSRYFVNTKATGYSNETSFRYFDSVGIGSYSMDIRILIGSTGISPPYSLPAPFYIPYRSLASHNVRNLLASGKLMAQTYLTNAAYRLHPIEWSSGSAAGTAAALLFRDNKKNHELLDIPALREYQSLVASNSPIRWDYSGEPALPPQDGDLIINDFKDLTAASPFEIEVYHPTAVRAVIEVNGSFFAQTRTRANGRLYFDSTGISTTGDELEFLARCFDAGDNEIAILTTTVVYGGLPCGLDPTVSDNDNPTLFSTTGAWPTGSGQADRYCDGSYRYLFGDASPGVATWLLRTPQPGIYKISIWYSEANNRATDSPFTIHHRDGSTTIEVNQQTNGGGWISLGEYPFELGPNEKVTLTNIGISDSSKLVTGDAVRAELIEPFTSFGESWRLY